MKIGIIGCGMVGGVMARWLDSSTSHEVLKYDPALDLMDDVSKAGVVFVSVPVPTLTDGTQDLTVLHESIDRCHIDANIFVRSTVLPGTCDELSKGKRRVFSMPEFFTERTAMDDFTVMPLLTGCPDVDLLTAIFEGKKEMIHMENMECELAKYGHNVFAALKVNYFNHIYELCKRNEIQYQNVKKGILMSGLINKNHTDVPGHDGKFGFGGKCLPKDLKAFSIWNPAPMARIAVDENAYFRKSEFKID